VSLLSLEDPEVSIIHRLISYLSGLKTTKHAYIIPHLQTLMTLSYRQHQSSFHK